MRNKLFVAVFLIILSIGVFLRFYKLGDIPNSLDWDEVSQGYNAYSILTTGKDEFGTARPLTIRSFNDYKPPAYVYLAVLPIKIFGLNAFSARFPSALFGSLSIFLVYALIYEIFKKEKYVKKVSLLSMFFFSISPMSIQFSRTGFDANIAVFFVLLGAWLFIRYASKEKIWPIFLGVFFLAVSVYTAHSEKIFTPLLLVCLFLYKRKFFFQKRKIMIFLVIFFTFLNIFWFFDPQTKVRSKGVLFTSSSDFLVNPLGEMLFDKTNNNSFNSFFHNRRFAYISKYLENYLSHFDPNYLFVHGDNARHHAPGMGILYLMSLPFIFIGMFFVIRKKIYSSYILFAWIFIAPIASGFAIDAPNYQRSLIFLPTFHIFEALGWIYLFSLLRRIKFSSLYMMIIIILFSINVSYYLHQYFAHTNTEYGQYWQYGYKEAIGFTKKYIGTEKRIFFANDIEQGYVFYLFYNKYDPQKYIAGDGSNRNSFGCYSIDNAYFGACNGLVRKGDIYITSKEQTSPNFKIVTQITYPYNETAVWVLEYL